VTFASGLSEYEVKQRLTVYGTNAIRLRQKAGLISVLVHQFKSLMVALLALLLRLHSTFGNERKAAQSLAS
jgi:magnesium-transporting ATPase (P-type)